MKYENLPFPIGTTYTDGGTVVSTDGANLEGKEFEIEDLDYSATGVPPQRSNLYKRVRVVRNTSGIALLPKRLGSLKAGTPGQVDGYGTTTAQGQCFPIDEFLAAAGVPNNDLFYITVAGYATVLTDLGGAANNVISVDNWIIALTAATSQATTAGRAQSQMLTGATALLGDQVQHRIGRALSAKTTANTDASLLINVTRF